MMQNIAAPIVQRNWWIMALRGLFAVIFGLIALLAPGIALLAFIYVFAAYALVDGGIAVITAIQERELLYRWGWILFEGILSILAGIIAFANPALTGPGAPLLHCCLGHRDGHYGDRCGIRHP